MATGSNLINTSSTGQPSDNEDRPFSFAIGTQIFLNPNDDPTDAVVTFKANANLLAGSLTSGQSNLSIGLSVDSELNTLSQWGGSQISQPSANRFPVGFGRLSNAPQKISVNIEGTQVATIGKPSVASSIDTASNSISITGHPFNTGDRVVVTSTANLPGGLSGGSNAHYFVINESINAIKLATTRANAVSNTDIDIQSSGSGTITVASDEIFTLTRAGSSGSVTLKKADVTIATFTNTNASSPLRLFYWNREQSASQTDPVLKEIKVTGAI